ncbi:MAG: sel1 repeat family protein [Candidatus Riflebacteria bacterium]|nr:sel1 repeat family protein [Candidatus Riflebacteria bacterium]
MARSTWLLLALAACAVVGCMGSRATPEPAKVPTPAEVEALRKQADTGDEVDQAKLGELHFKGRGVPQSYADALKWFRKAAEKNDLDALYRLGEMHERGLGVAPSLEEAKKYYQRSADRLGSGGLIALSRIYETGRGSPRDPVRAYVCMLLAEQMTVLSARMLSSLDPSDRFFEGSTEAIGRKRQELETQLTPAQITEAQRLAEEWAKKSLSLSARPATSPSPTASSRPSPSR